MSKNKFESNKINIHKDHVKLTDFLDAGLERKWHLINVEEMAKAPYENKEMGAVFGRNKS